VAATPLPEADAERHDALRAIARTDDVVGERRVLRHRFGAAVPPLGP
jgi:hypothetical protein